MAHSGTTPGERSVAAQRWRALSWLRPTRGTELCNFVNLMLQRGVGRKAPVEFRESARKPGKGDSVSGTIETSKSLCLRHRRHTHVQSLFCCSVDMRTCGAAVHCDCITQTYERDRSGAIHNHQHDGLSRLQTNKQVGMEQTRLKFAIPVEVLLCTFCVLPPCSKTHCPVYVMSVGWG